MCASAAAQESDFRCWTGLVLCSALRFLRNVEITEDIHRCVCTSAAALETHAAQDCMKRFRAVEPSTPAQKPPQSLPKAAPKLRCPTEVHGGAHRVCKLLTVCNFSAPPNELVVYVFLRKMVSSCKPIHMWLCDSPQHCTCQVFKSPVWKLGRPLCILKL